jgi:hypothetical protein
LFLLAAISVSASLGSCAPAEPSPPDVSAKLDAYENPTAEVNGDIMAAVADRIEELRDDIGDSEVFDEILAVIADVQEELDAATVRTCSGGAMNGSACEADADCPDGTCVANLVLNGTCNGGPNDGSGCADDADCPDGTCGDGVAYPSPSGALQAKFICEGWDESQTELDPANGVINLTLTLGAEGIGPLVWGEAEACKFPVVTEVARFDASYDGSLAVHLGGPVSTSQNLYELPITFFITGTIGFEGADLPVDVSYRVALSFDETSEDVGLDGLELLVEVPDDHVRVPGATEYFVYFFKFDTLDQGIRDATGTFNCRLRSENGEPPGCFIGSETLFSW